MSYIINETAWDIDRVMQRIIDTDLTPSIQPIKEDIKNKFDRLKKMERLICRNLKRC